MKIILVENADVSRVTTKLESIGDTLDVKSPKGMDSDEWSVFEGLLVAYEDVLCSSKAHRVIRAWDRLEMLARWPVLISSFAGLEMTLKGIILKASGKKMEGHCLATLYDSLPKPYKKRVCEAAAKWLASPMASTKAPGRNLEEVLKAWSKKRRTQWFYLPLEKRLDRGSMWDPGLVRELWGIVLNCWAQVDGLEHIVSHHNVELPNY